MNILSYSPGHEGAIDYLRDTNCSTPGEVSEYASNLTLLLHIAVGNVGNIKEFLFHFRIIVLEAIYEKSIRKMKYYNGNTFANFLSNS